MVRQLAGAAAEVQHAAAVDVRQQRQQVDELGRPLPASAEALERGIAGEEAGVVVDVLRLVAHDDLHHSGVARASGSGPAAARAQHSAPTRKK